MKFKASENSKKVEAPIRDILVPARELEKRGIKLIKLNIGDPVKYGFKAPDYIIKTLDHAANATNYSDSEGEILFRKAIAKHEKEMSNINVDENKVLPTSGISEGIFFLLASILNSGDEILIPGPSYPQYIGYSKLFGATPVEYRCDEENGWQPDLEDIRKKITAKTRAIVIINPNNPTGAVYSEKVLREIAGIAGENNLILISDEIYSQLTFDRKSFSMGLVSDIPMILMNGLSKSYLIPGWRLGYIIFRDNGELDEIRDSCLRLARTRLSMPTPMQLAGAEILGGPKNHIKEMNEKLKKQRDYFMKRVGEIDGLSCVKPEGAFYAFPKILNNPFHSDKEWALELLKRERVLVVHGSGFGNFGVQHFRTVILPEIEILSSAFDGIERFVKSRREGNI